jgi:glycosyltransferase involved in cell wall biosynthesis
MPQANRLPRVTLITPVHNETENLQTYVKEVTTTLLDQADIDADVLFVDDGSSDDSWKFIMAIAENDNRFRGLRLSRNFGSHVAITAGIDNISPESDAAVVLAADLQDPPATVLEFIKRWRAGADIVWGRRATRLDSRWRIWASRLFQGLLERYAMPKGSQFTTGSFFLIDRKVIEAVSQFAEANRIMFALVAWTGFEQDTVEYARRKRMAGQSGWKFTDMIKTMYDAFVGFSAIPIKLMQGAAFISLLAAIILTAYILIASFTRGIRVPGWTSQMLLLTVFFGVQFWLVAIVGQYLARIHREVVRRPLYFVSQDTLANPITSVIERDEEIADSKGQAT